MPHPPAHEPTHPDRTPRDPRRTAMAVSLGVSFVMLAGKATAFWVTGSTAIYSDAAESVIHLLATAFVGFSLWYSVQPPDEGHPYGHGKIAYLAAGFEGALILVAAVTILYQATVDLVQGPTLNRLDVGALLLVVLAGVNAWLGRYLIRTGRRYNNLVLVSNGQHVLTDMWTTGGVVVGLVLVSITGLEWLDPVMAILVAVNIVWTASRLLRRSVAGLMEKADRAETEAILRALRRACEMGTIIDFHQVRHRRVHDQVWVEYHLHFPGELTLEEAHARSHDVEDAIQALFADDAVTVTAHLEPEYHEAAHPDGHAEPSDPLREAGS